MYQYINVTIYIVQQVNRSLNKHYICMSKKYVLITVSL